MPYEFSGLYVFGTPLPSIDEESVVSPAQKAALQRAVAEMMSTPEEKTPMDGTPAS